MRTRIISSMALSISAIFPSFISTDTNNYENPIMAKYEIKYNNSGDTNLSTSKKTVKINERDFSNIMILLNEYIDDIDNYFDDFESLFLEKLQTSYFNEFFDWIIKNEKEKYLIQIVSILLNTDIDIFSLWYVKGLEKCINSDSCIISERAKSIYNLYKNKFEEVKCM